MTVKLRPKGLLKKYCRELMDDTGCIELPDDTAGATLEAVCREIGLPAELISLFIVNGQPEKKEYRLKADDDVKCIALIGGG